MSSQNMVYLGLCIRYEPPIIGIHYKLRAKDEKKKVYTILLHKLVLHPDPEEAARQLYRQHPHILKEDKIPLHKIATLIAKIQEELQLNDGDYYADEYEESGEQEEQYLPKPPASKQPQKEVVPEKKPMKRPKYMDNQFEDDGPLNRSL